MADNFLQYPFFGLHFQQWIIPYGNICHIQREQKDREIVYMLCLQYHITTPETGPFGYQYTTKLLPEITCYLIDMS